MKNEYPADALPVMAEGDDWNEIKRDARAVANAPFGTVELDRVRHPHMGITKRYGEGKSHYAYVVVTPVPPAKDHPDTYTLDELNRAYTDLMGNYGTGGTSGEKFLDRVARQVRKNRVFDLQANIR